MYSKRRTKRTIEEIEAIIKRGEALGLHKTLGGYFEGGEAVRGVCTTLEQLEDMAGLVAWVDNEYGLLYISISAEESDYGEKPESDLSKVLTAIDTIRAYVEKYNVPQLTENGEFAQVERVVRNLRPVEPKRKNKFIGEVRETLKKKISERGYANKKKLVDGLMNTFKELVGNALK